jgi:signal transduction histidine kinase
VPFGAAPHTSGVTIELPAPSPDRSLETADLVLDIVAHASGEDDISAILQTTIDRLARVIPLTGGSIALVEGRDLVVRAAHGPFSEAALGQRLPKGASRSWRVVEERKPFRSGDLDADGLHVTTPGAAGVIRSWLGVPVVRRGVGIGLLEVDSDQPEVFTDADVELLGTVALALSGPVDLAIRRAAERRANELRQAFVGVISHELRTPITTIYGLSTTLRRHSEQLSPERRREALADLESEADRLRRLVEDLLVLSRAEVGQVEVALEPVLLGRLLRGVVDNEATRWADRRFTLELQRALPLVDAEPMYVEQVTRNLLANAAKYSASGSEVRIVAEADTVGGEVVVRVFDTGIGIPPADADRLFEIFYRAPEAAQAAAGAGIGLFVCRQLVEAMGGRIMASGRPEGGSEFAFTLPISTEGDAA